jgi:hypothetical protein
MFWTQERKKKSSAKRQRTSITSSSSIISNLLDLFTFTEKIAIYLAEEFYFEVNKVTLTLLRRIDKGCAAYSVLH